MDPNAALQELLALKAKIMRQWDAADDTCDFDEADVIRMAELVEALDGWIRKGGFLPERWRPRPHCTCGEGDTEGLGHCPECAVKLWEVARYGA